VKLLVAVLLLAVAAGVGFIAGDRTQEGDTTTVTRSVVRTVTRTAAAADLGVPEPVLAKREEILRATDDRDYDAVARLADPNEFNYTFGDETSGPAAYWRQRAAEGEDPLAALERILELPYTLNTGIYVWPFAYDKTGDQLTDYERTLLGDLLPGGTIGDTGYLGWRAGIRPDGRWVFFVAGD
jgi:hypothetical protein